MPQPKVSGLDDGYGAPFVRVFYKDEELTAQVEEFEYEYFEEGDDVCKITMKFDVRDEPDKPYWQEKTELKVLWGYIRGEVSPTRKVYIQQVKWKFDRDSITASIEATDKANSLKYEDSQEIHSNTSLLDITNKIAKKHNLKAFLEVPTEDEDPLEYVADPGVKLKGETFSKYLKRNYQAIKDRDAAIARKKQEQKLEQKRFGLDKAPPKPKTTKVELDAILGAFNAIPNPKKPDSIQFVATRKPGDDFDVFTPKFPKVNQYTSIPQANKNDSQIIHELGHREHDGPYIADTRDDEIILKKRNFRQAPYKSYVFGGDEGSLTDFCPMSKNFGHKQSALNVGFAGWNAPEKYSFSGNANGLPDTNETISDFVKAYKFWKKADKSGAGNYTTEGVVEGIIGREPGLGVLPKKFDDLFKSTDVNKWKRHLTVHERVEVMEKSIKQYDQEVANLSYNPLGNDPNEAFNIANNTRRAHELKMNPATAEIYGDPALIVGILITVLGVSKKYSSNYYVIKATHKISSKGGYMVSLEMCTQGSNIKPTSDFHKSKGRVNKSTQQLERMVKKILSRTNPKK